MANKKWSYIISYVNPADLDTKTPAQRGEIEFLVDATSVPRAVSIAKKIIVGEHPGITAGQIVIVDVVREKSPLVSEWAATEEEA